MQKQRSRKIMNDASITALRYISKPSDRLCFGQGCRCPVHPVIRRLMLDHNYPVGWMRTGEDAANTALGLASGVSQYVTSHAIIVDGGITESTEAGFLAQQANASYNMLQ
jgi:NAD(P)-dependent dehydrogenase (short-subunit alcohol dehydrogenase family)